MSGGGGGTGSDAGALAPGDLTPAGLAAAVAPHVSAALALDAPEFRGLVASLAAGRPLVQRLAVAAFDRAFPALSSPAAVARVARRVIETLLGKFGPRVAPYVGPALEMFSKWPGFEPGTVRRAYVDALGALLATAPAALPDPVRYGLAHPAETH